MTILAPRPRPLTRTSPKNERLNRRGSLEPRDPQGPRRMVVIALVLTCLTLASLDQTPVLGPVRTVVGSVFGPLESASTTLVRPLTGIPGWFDSRHDLRTRLAKEQAANRTLRRELRTSDYGRAKLAEYESLTSAAQDLGYALVPARVTAYGSAQTFKRTVTIDAGSAAGVTADMSVVTGDGLVGRVLRTTASTATVLLITDADSVVGGRVGGDAKHEQVGTLHGTGAIAGPDSRTDQLDLELLDQTSAPLKGETVVSWGAGHDAPYVSGLPIGEVTGVYASVRDSSRTVRVKPFVDFGSLDVVGVVVPGGTKSDRAVVEPDGSLR
ncbi:MAG: rod shape-determining protein MreC [Nocardioides sp.]|nr:rod shape-determining protein MreC [Nocardioides sp.]